MRAGLWLLDLLLFRSFNCGFSFRYLSLVHTRTGRGTQWCTGRGTRAEAQRQSRTGRDAQTDAPQQLWQGLAVWLLFVLCAGLGDCFRLLERHHESIHCCTEALKHKAVYPEAMLTRARSALSTGYHQQALKDYQHLLQNHLTVFQPPSQNDEEQASRQQVDVQFLALL